MMSKVLLHTDGKGLDYYASDEKRSGMLHVITGDGKGKTTSSIGMCVRASGHGSKVFFVQFFKRTTGELEPLQKLDVDVYQFKFLGPFFKKYNDEEFREMQKEFQRQWNNMLEKFHAYDLVVLDEIVYAVTEGIIPEENFLQFLDSRPEGTEMVLTGRDFPDSIIKRADYVSDIRRVKHPFDRGIDARKGVEF